ncbi:MAG: hypothetical protein PHH90_08895 [Limnochordia bacterium]|nr:hypothetical protein [Limnochordia bacterium]
MKSQIEAYCSTTSAYYLFLPPSDIPGPGVLAKPGEKKRRANRILRQRNENTRRNRIAFLLKRR